MSETQTHLPFFWCSTYGHAKGEIKKENIKVYCCFSSVYIKCVMESFNVHSFTFSNQFIIVMCDDIFVSQLNWENACFFIVPNSAWESSPAMLMFKYN